MRLDLELVTERLSKDGEGGLIGAGVDREPTVGSLNGGNLEVEFVCDLLDDLLWGSGEEAVEFVAREEDALIEGGEGG